MDLLATSNTDTEGSWFGISTSTSGIHDWAKSFLMAHGGKSLLIAVRTVSRSTCFFGGIISDTQAVFNSDAGRHDEKTTGKFLAAGASHRINRLPRDQHDHKVVLPAPVASLTPVSTVLDSRRYWRLQGVQERLCQSWYSKPPQSTKWPSQSPRLGRRMVGHC